MADGPLIAFAGGGTGGHLYPALAVADALRVISPGVRFIFFGTQKAIDRGVLGPLADDLVRQRVQPLPRRIREIPRFLRGFDDAARQCRSCFARHRPRVVVGSGGYAGAPPIYEANLAGIPTALLNPDAAPGKANRLLGSRVNVVFAQWEDTRRYFNGQANIEALGCPVRPGFATASRQAGIQRFGLDPGKRVLLVTGASQGARSINQAVVNSLDQLLSGPVGVDWQVLHLTGAADHAEMAASYARRPCSGTVLAYTEHMAEAMAAADLVVCRAGASTLAELTAMAKPSVLLPYPYGDRHQRHNAAVLDRAGAAVVVEDQVDPAINTPVLTSTLRRFMADEHARTLMGAAAGRLGTCEAATLIAKRLLVLAGSLSKALAG